MKVQILRGSRSSSVATSSLSCDFSARRVALDGARPSLVFADSRDSSAESGEALEHPSQAAFRPPHARRYVPRTAKAIALVGMVVGTMPNIDFSSTRSICHKIRHKIGSSLPTLPRISLHYRFEEATRRYSQLRGDRSDRRPRATGCGRLGVAVSPRLDRGLLQHEHCAFSATLDLLLWLRWRATKRATEKVAQSIEPNTKILAGECESSPGTRDVRQRSRTSGHVQLATGFKELSMIIAGKRPG